MTQKTATGQWERNPKTQKVLKIDISVDGRGWLKERRGGEVSSGGKDTWDWGWNNSSKIQGPYTDRESGSELGERVSSVLHYSYLKVVSTEKLPMNIWASSSGTDFRDLPSWSQEMMVLFGKGGWLWHKEGCVQLSRADDSAESEWQPVWVEL